MTEVRDIKAVLKSQGCVRLVQAIDRNGVPYFATQVEVAKEDWKTVHFTYFRDWADGAFAKTVAKEG